MKRPNVETSKRQQRANRAAPARNVHAWALLIVCILVSPVSANEARVVLRGDDAPISGRITMMHDAAITIENERGELVDLVWDRVRDVEMADRDARLDRYLPLAEKLWRARSRLQRGDAVMAEPLFEELFEEFQGRTHEMALIVAEGLLRCRLARQAHEEAVVPLLETIRLRRAEVATDRYDELPPVIDDDVALSPALAPAWAVAQRLPRLERELARYDANDDEVVEAMREVYHAAVRHAMGESVVISAASRDVSSRHAGVALLYEAVSVLLHGDQPREARGREAAELRRNWPDWTNAWLHYAHGMSMIQRSDSRDEQKRGCVRLLHIPAAHARTQQYLAGLALHHVAAWHEQAGLNDAAASLRDELNERFATHPIQNVAVRSGNRADAE